MKLLSVSARPYISTSTKSFSDLNKIWCVGRGRWVIHDGMPYDPIQGQGQGHGGPKVAKMVGFKVCLLRCYACNQKTNVDYDTPRQYVNFNRTDFWYLSSFGVTWPSNIGCSIFGKRILSLTRSRPAVLYGACYYYYYYWLCYCCSINGDSSFCSVCVHAIILRIIVGFL